MTVAAWGAPYLCRGSNGRMRHESSDVRSSKKDRNLSSHLELRTSNARLPKQTSELLRHVREHRSRVLPVEDLIDALEEDCRALVVLVREDGGGPRDALHI